MIAILTGLGIAAALTAPMAAHAQNLITDGGFQHPDVTKNTIESKGTTLDSAWLVQGGPVTVLNGYGTTTGAGQQSLALGSSLTGGSNGGVKQTFTTPKKATQYDVSVWVSSNTTSGLKNGVVSTGLVSFDGLKPTTGTNTTGTISATSGNTSWQQYNWTFTAPASTSQTVSFLGTLHGVGLVIDKVSVQAVPEVTTWLGFAVLLALGALFMRKQRTAGAIAAL
jgi:hypothetical protein